MAKAVNKKQYHILGREIVAISATFKDFKDARMVIPIFPIAVQFSSVAQSCPTLCDPMNCSTPGLPVHHQLLEFTQTHCPSGQCHPTISSSLVPFSSCPQSIPASLPTSQLFTSGGQSTGVSASASVLPMNTQDYLL